MQTSLDEQRRAHDEAILRLRAEYDSLEAKIDIVHSDKLSNRISDAHYDRKLNEILTEQSRCLEGIENLRSSQKSYTGKSVLLLSDVCLPYAIEKSAYRDGFRNMTDKADNKKHNSSRQKKIGIMPQQSSECLTAKSATYLLPNNSAPAQILDADWSCRTRYPSGVSIVKHAKHIDDAIGQKLTSVAVRFAGDSANPASSSAIPRRFPVHPVKFR